MTFKVSLNAPSLYPAESLFALLYCDDSEVIEIPQIFPIAGEWGQPLSFEYDEPVEYGIPVRLDLVYLSIVEGVFYGLEVNFDKGRLDLLLRKSFLNIDNDSPLYIIVGIAPYGCIAVWVFCEKKSFLFDLFQASQVRVPMELLRPSNPDLTLNGIINGYMKSFPNVKLNLDQYGLPAKGWFGKLMQQFNYRYNVAFGFSEDEESKSSSEKITAELDWVEESLLDGTFDKMRDGGLMQYHMAGKPGKLAVQWHVGKAEYTAYFWMDEEQITAIFDRFYGAHRDTKTDFIIRIDAENRKYELAMFRQGLQEPQVIPESAYQMIVFRNKFEDYRSENYNQPRGAWIW